MTQGLTYLARQAHANSVAKNDPPKPKPCSSCNGDGGWWETGNGEKFKNRRWVKVPDVQRNRRRVLTDRLPCPGCGGAGQQAIGPLRMTCRFCRGLGYVGGDNEPAEEHDEPRPAARPVWEEPAARTLTVCRVCFGTRKVVNLGGTGEPTGKLVELPCPACSAERQGAPLAQVARL
jgi:hypothetical protein